MDEFYNIQNPLIDKCISIIRGYWGSRACPQCLSCKLASFRMNDFPLVLVISHLFQPSRSCLLLGSVHVWRGQGGEMLESRESDKPAAKGLFYPLLPPLLLFMAFQVGRSIPEAGSRLADVGICCSRSCSLLLLGYSEGRFLLPSFQSPSWN